MCLAIPAKIVEIDNGMGICNVGESDTQIKVSLMLLEGQVDIGDFIIVHAGFGLRKMDPKEAEETLTILRDMLKAQGELANF